MTTTNGTAINVFISYAHEDEKLLKQLQTHLSSLIRQGLIATWYDRQIVAGSDWAGVIDEHLEQASIILLLVSADFLASDYCYKNEMMRALERHDAGQARVIPIALRPADWKGLPFASLQVLPTDTRAITLWDNEDAAFVDVVAGIRRAIEDLSQLPASVARKSLPPIWNIPYARNSFFLGRDELLERLHAQLQAGKTTTLSQPPQAGQALSQHPHAISGLGGIVRREVT
jgi:TIR domain